MNVSTFLRRSPVPTASSFICWRCQSKRRISQGYLQRKAAGRQQWAEQAKEIRNGTRKSMLAILQERGLVQDIAGGSPEEVSDIMTSKRVGVYVGIDPTAPSLHVGNMMPLMALFWFFYHGFHALSLLGGSTARIGDPSGRTTDRREMTPAERKANMAAMHYQLKKIWLNAEKFAQKRGFTQDEHWKRDLVNNNTWWNKLPMLEVLRLIGPAFRIGPMLGRDTVRTKLDSGVGVSFPEFCYPILQAWDWWQMYEQRGIQVQIGGSDQYGNIVAGVDAVRYAATNHPDPDVRRPDGDTTTVNNPFGLTVPLLTTASGQKFGKSAGNAIWLDDQMTSVFDLYGFFVGTDDRDVQRYLKVFTFLPLDKIQSICDEHAIDPTKRLAQHTLARDFVELIHGETAAAKAEAQHRASRSNSLSTLLKAAGPDSDPDAADDQPKPNPLLSNQHHGKRQRGTYINRNLNQYAPLTDQNTNRGPMNIILPKSLVFRQPIARVLFAASLVSSRSEGHRLTQNGGAYIGSQSDAKTTMSDAINYTPAKLSDPDQTWRHVIRDADGTSQHSREGEMQNPDEEGVLILRAGKWKVRIIRIVSDRLFESMNITPPPPGWVELKAERIAALAEERYKTQAESEELVQDAAASLYRPAAANANADVNVVSRGEESIAPWPRNTRTEELDGPPGENLDPWHEFEGTARGRRATQAGMRESREKGMQYFERRGVEFPGVKRLTSLAQQTEMQEDQPSRGRDQSHWIGRGQRNPRRAK